MNIPQILVTHWTFEISSNKRNANWISLLYATGKLNVSSKFLSLKICCDIYYV